MINGKSRSEREGKQLQKKHAQFYMKISFEKLFQAEGKRVNCRGI